MSLIKFCFKASILVTEALSILQKAYGDNSLKRITVFEWYGCFPDGRESIENDEHCLTSKSFDTLPNTLFTETTHSPRQLIIQS